MRSTPLLFAAGLTAIVSTGRAEEPTSDQVQFFENKVRPLLSQKCYKCHSAETGKSKGGLTLDSRDAVLKGGENGAAVKPGDPDGSLLIKAISYKDADLQMPPKGEKMSDQEIADLTAWVKMGAPDPRKEAKGGKLSGLTDKARSHWSYQPVKKPEVPAVKNRAWCVTPIDAFVLKKLEDKGMTPSPPASKETLLRRAYFDLVGLPPSLSEINDFVADESPNAFAKVVDRLLASPHYGERWGRFWLDTARYADTTGVRDERGADYRFPYAWTYRDWVVKAFNDDMPYDQFITHQLAADKLPNNPKANLAALGFISVGEKFQNQNDIINDRIDVVSKGFLAMTVSCARCHDHMFDPIPQKDYYALHGVFASTIEPGDKPIIKDTDPKLFADFQAKIAAAEQDNRDKYYKVLDDYSFMFRQKTAAYIMVAHLGGRDASEENQQKAEKLAEEEKLERNLVNEVRNRIRSRDNEIFGPLARFKDGGDSWKAIAAQVAKDKRYNPIVAAAFQDANPKNFEDLAQIYAKVFSGVDTKAKEVIKAYAAAKAAPAGKTTKTAANGASAKPGMMGEMSSSMSMMSMSGGSDGGASALSGIDPALAALSSAPFKMYPAYELDNDSLRGAVRQWQLQIQGRGRFDFSKVNELLLTHDGSPARAMVVADTPKPHDSPVFIRGQAEARGDVVPRHFLEVLSNGRPQPFRMGSGRLELAQCIANKNNPLTARVMVNRVWMHHFGQGFVRTPDDLGTMSESPSHQELLDYLAAWFMDQGWSLKNLHKAIMLSRVYQESSYTVPAYETVDPENRLLWRANIRRLDFEAMRDSMLVMSGQLDRAVGGQPVNLTDEPYSYRRSIYGYVDRGNLPELMLNFDFSNPEMPNSARTTTIVPQQALFLMNSPMAVDVARRVINRQDVVNAGNPVRQLLNVYRIILGRQPTKQEYEMATTFINSEIKKQAEVQVAMKDVSATATEQAKKKAMARANASNATKAIQNEGNVVDRRPLSPWETFAQVLLMSNEASYIN